jgi:threonylcarbamoyladenosine tRNA methylthiotransferase MtaB
VDEILGEIRRVSAAGFREMALTGVHLGSYGRDLGPGHSLLHLLRRIEGEAPPSTLFRISSLEPMDCAAEIVALVAGSSCFAPHFHLPLQHASDQVLAAMRRPYTFHYYRRLVDSIREQIPHASIGSDVIVGFPGETAEDADTLLRYLEQSPLTHLHVFPYSDRPGTAATALPSKVNGVEVRRRGAAARNIGHVLARQFRRSQAGTVRRGLTIDDGTLVVTDNYLKVTIPPGTPRNEWVSVEIPRT